MWSFGAFCDEFYVNARLFLKLELEPSRETVLHYFEQLRRAYPRLTRLRRREDGGLIFDEDSRETHSRRYVRLDATALKFGMARPEDLQSVAEFGELLLSGAPVHLSLSDLDYDYMEVVYAFDLEYQGNHDELVAETLFGDHPWLSALAGAGEQIIDCQPFFGVALSDDCERQIYLEVKGRTSTFEVRTGEYDTTPLSIYLTVRRYWGGAQPEDLIATYRELLTIGERYAAERVVPHIVQPLAAAIASRR